ncbi:MAG TPA: FUSC family protein [Oxalicibacterium sp.]|nr:FUSC family protein [Oxalicibacterium sp.]
MVFELISPKKNALVYIVKILCGSLILWYGLPLLGFEEPYWAMISLIIVTEPDMNLARANFKARLINTLTGCIVACISLLIFGATFHAMLIAMVVTVAIAMLWQNYPSNWRLGPITVVILLSAAFTGTGVNEELHLAFLRVTEVIIGSIVALLQGAVYMQVMKWQEKYVNTKANADKNR